MPWQRDADQEHAPHYVSDPESPDAAPEPAESGHATQRRPDLQEAGSPESDPQPEPEPLEPDPEPEPLPNAVPGTSARRTKKGTARRPMAPARPVGAPRTVRTDRKRGNARSIVFAVAALVVLGGLGIGVISSLGAEPAAEEPRAAPEAPAEEIDPQERAEQTANAFLEAIRTADADALSGMLERPSTADTALFTDDVLADMLERHPMARESIAVVGAADTWGKQVVDVSYVLGDEEIAYTIGVDTATPGLTGAIDLDLPNLTFDGGYGDLDVSVNGVTVPTGSGDMYAVMPGIYELATSADHLRLSGEPIVATSGFAYAYTHEHAPVLTEEGLAEFRSRVRASAEECLASPTLEASCGLSVTGGLQGGSSLVDGTIERTIDDDSWAAIDALDPTPAAGDPLMMRDGFFSADVVFIGDWTGPAGAGRDQIYGGPSLVGPSVDFGDPDLPVSWGY